jgi:hypothetical protein
MAGPQFGVNPPAREVGQPVQSTSLQNEFLKNTRALDRHRVMKIALAVERVERHSGPPGEFDMIEPAGDPVSKGLQSNGAAASVQNVRVDASARYSTGCNDQLCLQINEGMNLAL